MGTYENGVSTRRAILDVCKKLFYEKGVHETSYDDICREAHVNRGSIYYHFKEKENIRYEVLLEYTIASINTVKKYCDDPVYQPSVGLYVIWYQLYHDPKMCKFYTDYFADYPVYSPENNLSLYYKTLWTYMYGNLWKEYPCEYLPFASVYSYIMGLIKLAQTYPERTTPLELYHQCFTSGNIIRGVPVERVNEVWSTVVQYINKIPERSLEHLFP